MNYCTVTDMVDFFGNVEMVRLTDINPPHQQLVVDSVAEKSIKDAQAEINMYLEGRNLLPLKSIPDVLRRITADVARYYLYSNPKDDHPVTKRYQQRVKQLEGVASGRLSLGLDAKGAVQAPEDVVMFSPGRNMFRNDTKGGGIW